MPTFIDESGDTGQVAGSQPYFRLAAVWLEDPEPLREAVRALRSRLGKKAAFEFKFVKTHTNHRDRRQFLELAMEFQFRFAVCSIAKQGYWRNASSQELHWAAATCISVPMGRLYQQHDNTIHAFRDRIIVDDNDDSAFLDSIRRAFGCFRSSYRNAPLTHPLRFRKSHTDDALQLTDMVCGAVGANLAGDGEWLKLIEPALLDIWEISK